ncbi:MAG: hypothetical protein Q8O14_04670 [bacterium]|jgi:hypothetical protein|nr:hypothetical protein [bacterium]
MRERRRGWPLLILMLLLLGCGGGRPEGGILPAPGWVGRQVQTMAGDMPLLDEPGGAFVGKLGEHESARVAERVTDETGRIWLRLEREGLVGWAPQDVLRLAQGEEGTIATH